MFYRVCLALLDSSVKFLPLLLELQVKRYNQQLLNSLMGGISIGYR